MAKAKSKAISLGVSAVFVIILVLIVGFGLFLNDTFNPGTTNTSTTVGSVSSSSIASSWSTPSTLTSSTTSSNTNKAVSVASNQFELVFRQVAGCGTSVGFIAPWEVVLSNGETIWANPNPSSSGRDLSPTNPSTIIFNVTSGNYAFSVQPSNILTPATGTVNVDNQNTTVTLDQELQSCGSTTTGTTFNVTTSTQSTTTTTTSVNETCTPMNTGNQTVTETITLCHSESTRSSNSSTGG